MIYESLVRATLRYQPTESDMKARHDELATELAMLSGLTCEWNPTEYDHPETLILAAHTDDPRNVEAIHLQDVVLLQGHEHRTYVWVADNPGWAKDVAKIAAEWLS